VDYFLKRSPIKDARVFMDAYDKKEVVPIPLIPKWVEYNQVYTEEFDKVRRGEASVPVALGAIKTRASELLRS
jgi:hypothetical protein